MNEEPTKILPDRGSFEERVFARFDAVDARFDAVDGRLETVDGRLETLESRAYDTKPIWERALKEIVETGLALGEVKSKVGIIENKVAVIENTVGIIENKVGIIETEVSGMKTDYAGIRNELTDMKRELKHRLNQKLDLILKFLLEDRDDIRDADERIKQLEIKLA